MHLKAPRFSNQGAFFMSEVKEQINSIVFQINILAKNLRGLPNLGGLGLRYFSEKLCYK